MATLKVWKKIGPDPQIIQTNGTIVRHRCATQHNLIFWIKVKVIAGLPSFMGIG